MTSSSTRSPLSAQERKAILDVEVSKQAQLGWKLSTRTDTSAQLTKNKGPNITIALLLLLIMILPGILYLIFAKGEVSLYLEVDEFGNIQRTENG